MKLQARVRMIQSIPNLSIAPIGKVGTVIENEGSEHGEHGNLVEFDEQFPAGHEGGVGKVRGKDGHCWYCADIELKELIGETA